MMIMGGICTRACSFCNVATGKPGALAPFEPTNVATAVAKLGLTHVVITPVDRDDLPYGGAGHFATVIRATREAAPATTLERSEEHTSGLQLQIRIEYAGSR